MKIITQMRAGDHSHYSERPGLKENSFEELGIMPFANSPEPFIPNFAKLCANDNLLPLAQMISKFDQSQKRIMIALLNASADLEELELVFGQSVYYNPSSPQLDYISNFVKAVPIGTRKVSGKLYIVLATNINDHGTCVLVERNSIYTRSEYKEKFRALLAEGKIHSPVPLWTPPERPTIKDIPTQEVITDNALQIDTAIKNNKGRIKKGRKGSFTVKIA